MTSPVLSFNKSFQIDVRQVVERLKKGEVGKHIEEIMHTDEVQEYFTEVLVEWAREKAKKMAEPNKQKFQEMTAPEQLWKNLSVNLSMSIFNNALAGWLAETDKSLDDVIIELFTVDMVKMVIDALRETFEGVAIQMQGRVIPFQSARGGSTFVN